MFVNPQLGKQPLREPSLSSSLRSVITVVSIIAPARSAQPTVRTLVEILRRKYRSWETAITAPSNFMRASSSISLEGMSRWLVGSSSTRKVPLVSMNLASAKRAFSPPLSTSTYEATGHKQSSAWQQTMMAVADTGHATEHGTKDLTLLRAAPQCTLRCSAAAL